MKWCKMSCKRAAWLALGCLCLWTAGCGGPSTAELIRQLGDADPVVRRAAVEALAEQTGKGERVVAALTTAVGDADPSVRVIAITALGEAGADSSLAALEQALENPIETTRVVAALAIQKIDPQAESYQRVILESLRGGNGPLFLEVGQMGTDAAWAVPTLIELTSHPRTHVRGLSARVLGEIGVADERVISALERRLNDSEPGVRHAAEFALGQLRSPRNSAVQ